MEEEYYEGVKTNKYNFNIYRIHFNLKEEGIRWDYLVEVVDKDYNNIYENELTHYLKDARKLQKHFMKIYK